ncbi:MAG: hypothetical protein HAW61_02865, partial [Candidatus Portiera sp.]|nr:hypothetical protein [Portiera sp.]
SDIISLDGAKFSDATASIEYNLVKGANSYSCSNSIPINSITTGINNNNQIMLNINVSSILTSPCQSGGNSLSPVGYAAEYQPYDRIENIKITELAITIQDAAYLRINVNHALGNAPADDAVFTLVGIAVPSYSYSVTSETPPTVVNIEEEVSVIFALTIMDSGNSVNLDGASFISQDAVINYVLIKENQPSDCTVNIPSDQISVTLGANSDSHDEITFELDVTSILTAECQGMRPEGYTPDFKPFDRIELANITGVSFSIQNAMNSRLMGTTHSLADIQIAGGWSIRGTTIISNSYEVAATDFPTRTIDLVDDINAEILANLSLNIRDSRNQTNILALDGEPFNITIINDLSIDYNLTHNDRTNSCRGIIPKEQVVAERLDDNQTILFNLNLTSIITAECRSNNANTIIPTGYADEFEPFDKLENPRINGITFSIQNAGNLRLNTMHTSENIQLQGVVTITGNITEREPIFPQDSYSHIIYTDALPAEGDLLLNITASYTTGYSISPEPSANNSLITFNTTTGEVRYVTNRSQIDLPNDYEYIVTAMNEHASVNATLQIRIANRIKFAQDSY